MTLAHLSIKTWVAGLLIGLAGVNAGFIPTDAMAGQKPSGAQARPGKPAAVAQTAPRAAAVRPAAKAPVRTAAQTASRAAVRSQPVARAPSAAARMPRQTLAQRSNLNRRLVTRPVAYAPPRLSAGQLAGLHLTHDPLELRSSVALVVDQNTSDVLFEKNTHAVLPIASITKLMTALVVVDARQNLNELLSISTEDIDTEKGSSSRLPIGTVLSRAEMLNLALMSSENRAAHALGRHYPGGMPAFVAAMNAKARSLGMRDTRYADPTGLSSQNVSSAPDLARLVKVAHENPILRHYSTTSETLVEVNGRLLQYRTTNGLVADPDWSVGLQKTGFISEAGNCLVMQAIIDGRPVIMVLLDAQGRLSRIGDAVRIRRWLESQPVAPVRRYSGADDGLVQVSDAS